MKKHLIVKSVWEILDWTMLHTDFANVRLLGAIHIKICGSDIQKIIYGISEDFCSMDYTFQKLGLYHIVISK